MPNRQPTGASFNTTQILILFGIFCLCAGVSFLLTTHSAVLVLGAFLAVILFGLSFINPRLALFLLIFSMLLSPEIGTRDYTGKGFTIRFEDVLLLIMGFAWLAKSAIMKNVGIIPRTPLNFPISAYMIACIISTGLGVMAGNVRPPLTGMFFVLKYFEYYVIFFLTVNNIRSKDHMRQLLGAILVTYVIVLVLGLIQIPKGVRITAPFEGESSEPNTLGGYLIIMFSLTATLFLTVRRQIYKAMVGMLATMCSIAIIFTLSRATWLGFAPMYVMLILMSKKRNVLIFFLLILGIAAPFFVPKIVMDRLLYTFRGDAGGRMAQMMSNRQLYQAAMTLDSSTQERLKSMKMVVKDFPKRPIFGYGVTGYYFLDAQYHRVLIETGAVGMAAFLFIFWRLGWTLYGLWKQYREDPLYNILITGTLCSFFGLVFQAIGTNTFIIVRIMEPFWCLVGLCVTIPMIESGRGIAEKASSPENAAAA